MKNIPNKHVKNISFSCFLPFFRIKLLEIIILFEYQTYLHEGAIYE